MNTTIKMLSPVGKYACICLLMTAVVLPGCDPEKPKAPADTVRVSEPPMESPPSGASRLRTVYVPAYSHLPVGPDEKRKLFAILLSVRNVDSEATVTLTHVDYFDTWGHRVRRYLKHPQRLRPLETAEFKVDSQDEAGGSGANFLVYWEGPSDAHPLLTESIMWGFMGGGYTTFTSRGVELDRRPTFADESPDVLPKSSDSDGTSPGL